MRTLIAVCGLLALTGCERYELDRQMEELCTKDGGVKVYETVTLPASYFDAAGRVKLGPPLQQELGVAGRERSVRSVGNSEYRVVEEVTVLKDGEPLKGQGRLRRVSWQVIRATDGSVLSHASMYGRSGGDFIVVGHFSSRTCPQRFGELAEVVSSTFSRGKD